MRLLPLGPLLAMLSGTSLLLAACSGLTSRPGPAFLVCENEAPAESVDTTVAGGVQHHLRVGEQSLTIPAAAIPRGDSVRFELRQVPGRQVRMIAEAEPQQQFGADVVLTLSYQGRVGCTVNGVPVSEGTQFRVHRVETGEFLPFAEIDDEQAVGGTTRSLSTFAIAG